MLQCPAKPFIANNISESCFEYIAKFKIVIPKEERHGKSGDGAKDPQEFERKFAMTLVERVEEIAQNG